MAHMRKYYRKDHEEVWEPPGGVTKYFPDGWALEMSQDVLWRLYAENPGPLPMRLRGAKPEHGRMDHRIYARDFKDADHINSQRLGGAQRG